MSSTTFTSMLATSSWKDIVAEATNLVHDASWTDAASKLSGLLMTALTHHWRHLALASTIPMARPLWNHFSRTVIHIQDEEHALWLRLWLMEQKESLKHIRELQLPSKNNSMGRKRNRDLYELSSYGNYDADDDEDDDEHEETNELDHTINGKNGNMKVLEQSRPCKRFKYEPASSVTIRTRVGFWPVFVKQASNGFSNTSHYSLTVWFAPNAKQVVSDILMEGRKLWLNKQTAKTEILESDGYSRTNRLLRPSRPLTSVIVEGKIKDDLLDDMTEFLKSEKWYISKGIPYRRGYLLYGPPGCGKSSLVTALAGRLRLPILIVSLSNKNMCDDTLLSTFRSAPKKCIILLEDIDCAFPKRSGKGKKKSGFSPKRLTFSGLLNAVDGVAAQEGRLLVMTTNYRNRLDEALIRPGRVDFQANIGKASKEGAADLFDKFYPCTAKNSEEHSKLKDSFLNKIEDGVHSFASLQGVFMKHRDDPSKVGKEIDELLRAIDEANVEESKGTKDDDDDNVDDDDDPNAAQRSMALRMLMQAEGLDENEDGDY